MKILWVIEHYGPSVSGKIGWNRWSIELSRKDARAVVRRACYLYHDLFREDFRIVPFDRRQP